MTALDQDRTGSEWPSSWTRAALELAVLALVARHGPTHGYEVARHLEDGGLGTVKGGTLYPVLGRLEEQGLVASEWAPGVGGPGRKIVRITPEGTRELRERSAAWRTWTARATAIITEQEGRS